MNRLLFAAAAALTLALVTAGAIGAALYPHFPLMRAGLGAQPTVGDGVIAGRPFKARSAAVVWNRTAGSLTLFLLPRRDVTCANVRYVAGLPGNSIQVPFAQRPQAKLGKVATPTVFVVIPNDPTAPQQASGLKHGGMLTLTRIDTSRGGIWHGRFLVPRMIYGDGSEYGFDGTFAAKWCEFRR